MPNRRRFFSSAVVSLGSASLLGAANEPSTRLDRAASLRQRRADAMRRAPVPPVITNGDEQRYANRIGSYAKTLRRNPIGEVEPAAYDSLLRACESGAPTDFEAIRRGGAVRLKNPSGAFGCQNLGLDQSQFSIPPAPRFDSAGLAAEMIELYWMSLARDIPFSAYASDGVIAEACAELRRTPADSFRGPAAGALAGPYVSQFLLQPVHFGSVVADGMPASAFATGEWVEAVVGDDVEAVLALHDVAHPRSSTTSTPTRRSIGRRRLSRPRYRTCYCG